MKDFGLSSLGRRARLACTAVIAFSLVLFVLVPIPEVAEAQSCPPGWTSCTAWSYDGACCCCIFAFYLGQNQSRVCTRWDHANNAYPNCTYQVVGQWTENRCVSPLC